MRMWCWEVRSKLEGEQAGHGDNPDDHDGCNDNYDGNGGNFDDNDDKND